MTELLFIDSEPVDDIIIQACSDRGLGFRQLADGNEALAYAKENRPSIMVLNVELPKVSGYTVCNKVKKDTGLKAVPLILTSSQATTDIFEQHKKLKTRAEEYLLKPYSSDDLLARIDHLMNGEDDGHDAGFAGQAAEVAADGGDDGTLTPPSTPFSMSPGDVAGGGDEMNAVLDAAVEAVDSWGESPEAEVSTEDVVEEVDAPPMAPPSEEVSAAANDAALNAEDKQAIREVRKENIQLKAKVAELESRLRVSEGLKDRLDKASEQNKQTRADLKKKEQEVLEFQELLDQQEDELESMRQQLVEKESNIANIRAVAEGAELDTEEAKSRVLELEKHEAELEAREKELSTQVASLSEQAETLETQMAKSKKEFEEQMEVTKAEYETQKEKLSKVKEAISQALSDLEG